MESWPARDENDALPAEEVARNLEAAHRWMGEEGLDLLVVTSADRYLNEYTPLEDNHRYLLSGFTGSTALLLVRAKERARLYVDGRYHLQADGEVDAALVDVVKVAFGTSIQQALMDDLKTGGVAGCEGDRMSQSFRQSLEKAAASLRVFAGGELRAALGKEPLIQTKPLRPIPEALDEGPRARLARTFKDWPHGEDALLYLGALDDIAWLTGARGYHFPYQSSFAAEALARPDGLCVRVDAPVLAAGPPPAEAVEWTAENLDALLTRDAWNRVKTFVYDPAHTTAAVVEKVKSLRPDWKRVTMTSPALSAKAKKSPVELEHMVDIHKRSSRVVARCVRWAREQVGAGARVSELEFHDQANRFYEEAGAVDLSFHTIAAIGSDSAIIHFSDPSSDVVAEPGDLMLLDSGALYEAGYATDITRTFLAGGGTLEASRKQKEIYTLVLKGLLAAQNAVFPEGTPGAFLDALARRPLFEAGWNYAHGTGHGVGIHVHEPGVGISPTTTLPMKANQVSSIEPGIYVEGFGGVRLENIVAFEALPGREGFLRCRPLVLVGFDPHLIDWERLDGREMAWLREYEGLCAELGTGLGAAEYL
ncbi:MAG TPA: M24 family metallopeptidase [Planctomycetes bacterium]|nr:M24 family metallopeptidase [Planctomycetota bacterium]